MKINIFKIKYNKKIPVNNGLTLVELMVVISIFLLITTVTIFDYGSFRSNVSLQNLTDDIALSIRKAQSFAIGARGVGTGKDAFTNSYGINFSVRPLVTDELFGSSKSFLMFSTPSLKKIYKKPIKNTICGDKDNGVQCMELFKITSPDFIKEIWIDVGDGKGLQLKNDLESSLDIIFTRPDPRAYFCYRASSTNEKCDDSTISSIKIVISNGLPSPKEKTKSISVQNTGQISIE